jgi:hypothetical protein
MDYLVAGDSAYPISGILMKPSSVEEAHIDENKRLFNAVCYIDYTCKLAMLLSVWKVMKVKKKNIAASFLKFFYLKSNR